jgi:hypothetical protein
MNFIDKNPQNFTQFPPLKLQFSTLNEYFTARAKDIEQREQQQQQQHEQQEQEGSEAHAVHPPAPNDPAFPSLPSGRDFFPFVPALPNSQYCLFSHQMMLLSQVQHLLGLARA